MLIQSNWSLDVTLFFVFLAFSFTVALKENRTSLKNFVITIALKCSKLKTKAIYHPIPILCSTPIIMIRILHVCSYGGKLEKHKNNNIEFGKEVKRSLNAA